MRAYSQKRTFADCRVSKRLGRPPKVKWAPTKSRKRDRINTKKCLRGCA